MIYFIQAGEGLIAIGYTRDPQNTLASFQVQSPVSLRLLCTIDGGYNLLREIRDTYPAAGRWHEPSEGLLNLITRITERKSTLV